MKLPYDASHEELWRQNHTYDIIVKIGFNDDPVVPGFGSAIFFHIAEPDYPSTRGCIALSMEDMLKVLAISDSNTKLEIIGTENNQLSVILKIFARNVRSIEYLPRDGELLSSLADFQNGANPSSFALGITQRWSGVEIGVFNCCDGFDLCHHTESGDNRKVEDLYTIRATRKLLDRVKQPIIAEVPEPSTLLGDWYATMAAWRPQVALFVNEPTLLPVLVPLAPAKTVHDRFPEQLANVLTALSTPPEFIESELQNMGEVQYAKTASRSHTGIMNEFIFLAGHFKNQTSETDSLIDLSFRLSGTPCSPLYKSHGTPKRELNALIKTHN